MKLKYYQTAVRYKNKMDDFHGWGVAAQYCTKRHYEPSFFAHKVKKKLN